MAPGGNVARSYRELLVWQKARVLAVRIYKATESFPRSEIYGLTSQLRRSAVSVASNIAEGQGRLTSGEFQQFLGHARGSLLELDTQIAIACDLGYLDNHPYQTLEQETYQVLGLINRLLDSLRLKKAIASKP
jgi:four helix bundle protein